MQRRGRDVEDAESVGRAVLLGGGGSTNVYLATKITIKEDNLTNSSPIISSESMEYNHGS